MILFTLQKELLKTASKSDKVIGKRGVPDRTARGVLTPRFSKRFLGFIDPILEQISQITVIFRLQLFTIMQ